MQRTLLATLGVGVMLLVSRPARAELFADDFESGTLLTSNTPAGKWASQSVGASCSVAAATGAAKRGNFGFAVVDGSSIAGSGVQGELVRSIASLTNVYARFWFRLGAVTTPGVITLAEIRLGATPFYELKLNIPGNQIEIGGINNVADYHSAVTSFTPSVNTWYLFELQLANVGTANAVLKLWVDGTAKAQVSNDYSNLDVDTLSLGQAVSADRLFAGTLHFDDYRVDSAPMASRFAMTGATPAAVNVGDCIPLSISLKDSMTGATTKAPYEVSGALSSGGSGAFYSDAACSFAVSAVKLTAGSQSAVTAYYRPTASGLSSLSVSQPDFLPATVQMQVLGSGTPSTPQPNPGSNDPEPQDLEVGSSCASSRPVGSEEVAVLLLGLLWLRRRSRLHPRT